MKFGYLKSLFLPSSRWKSLNPVSRVLRPYEPYTARQPVSTTTVTNPPSTTFLIFQERVSFFVASETPKLTKTGNAHMNVTLRRVHIKQCRNVEAIIITYAECVPVALINQHKKRSRHFVTCGLSGSPLFFHIFHKWQDFFLGGGKYWT
jgi:hypothetical protein